MKGSIGVYVSSLYVYVISERSRDLPVIYAGYAMLYFTCFTEALTGVVIFCMMIPHKKD